MGDEGRWIRVLHDKREHYIARDRVTDVCLTSTSPHFSDGSQKWTVYVGLAGNEGIQFQFDTDEAAARDLVSRLIAEPA